MGFALSVCRDAGRAFSILGVIMAGPLYTPTPSEIRKACRELRTGWSATEERQRRTGTTKQRPFELVEVSTPTDRHGEPLV